MFKNVLRNLLSFGKNFRDLQYSSKLMLTTPGKEISTLVPSRCISSQQSSLFPLFKQSATSCLPLNNVHRFHTMTRHVDQAITLKRSCAWSVFSIQPCRFKQRGMEYQPSVRKRTRKHGLHQRVRYPDGRAILWRRMLKGRKQLAHRIIGDFTYK